MINDLIGEIHRLGFQVNGISECPPESPGPWGISLFRTRDKWFGPWLYGSDPLDVICKAIAWAMGNG